MGLKQWIYVQLSSASRSSRSRGDGLGNGARALQNSQIYCSRWLKNTTHVSDGDGGSTADSVDVLAESGNVGTGGGSRANGGQCSNDLGGVDNTAGSSSSDGVSAVAGEGVLLKAASELGSAEGHVGIRGGAARVVRSLASSGGNGSGSRRGHAGASGGAVRDEGRLQTAGGAKRVLSEAGSVLGNTLGLVGRETVGASGTASVVGCVASTLASSVVRSTLSLVGRKTVGAGGSASVVGSNTASGSGTSGGVLGSDGTNEGERGNSGVSHICGRVVI